MKKKVLVFAAIMILLVSYVGFSTLPSTLPPGVIKSEVKSFNVTKYTGASQGVATFVENPPFQRKLAQSSFLATSDGFKSALDSGEEDALAALGVAARELATDPIDRGFGIWRDARSDVGAYRMISGDNRAQLIQAGKNYLIENPIKKIFRCAAVYEPVCGKDNKTYANKCEIGNAGIDALCESECPCTTPAIHEINPTEGHLETMITIKGIRFTAVNNTIKFDDRFVINLDSPDGKTLMFNVSDGFRTCSYLHITNASCPAWIIEVELGIHRFSVVNAKGESNGVEFNLTSINLTEPPIVVPQTGVCVDCDTQTKTGLSFEVNKDVSVLNMAVCNANATEKECREASSCGVDKPCICESFLKNNCEVRCFNTKGKYYVLVDGFRGLFDSVDEKDPPEGGYDYVCPAVSTDSLMKTKQNLMQLQGKISVIAAKVDLIKANAPDNDTAAAFQKYSDVFKKISDMIDAQIKSIDAALASPTEEGIQQNQAKADDLKKDIVDMLKTLE